jgi:hypothetical protein
MWLSGLLWMATYPTLFPKDKRSIEGRRNVMSNIMKPPPPESSAAYVPPPVSSQPPRKSYRGVWIVLGIFVAVSMVGVALLAFGAGFFISTYAGPSIASDQYYTALRDQNYTRAYSYLGAQLKTVYSQEAFTQMAQDRDAAAGRVSHYSYANIPVGDPATVTLTVTRADGTTYTVHLEMRQEGGAWKVTAFDRI